MRRKSICSFAVLDGYYLYRARFGFASATTSVTLRDAEFPKGETHSDEYFGAQEIYRGKFEIAIPYQRTAAADTLALNSSCRAAPITASATSRRVGTRRSSCRRARRDARSGPVRAAQKSSRRRWCRGDRRPAARRASVRDERALRQAERAHGRLADRAGLLPLSRQTDVHAPTARSSSAARRCRKASRTRTRTSATSRFTTTTSRRRFRSHVRARMRSTSS